MGSRATRLGETGKEQGDWRSAVTHYQQAYAIDHKLNRLHAARDIAAVGSTCINLSRFPQAKGALRLALAQYRELRDRRGEAHARLNLAFAYYMSDPGTFLKARPLSDSALAFCRAIKYRRGEAHALSLKASIAMYQSIPGDYRTAWIFRRPALSIYRELKDRRNEASVLVNFGLDYTSDINAKRRSESFSAYERALAMYRGFKDRLGEATVLYDIGINYKMEKLSDKAFPYFQWSRAIYREIKDVYREGETVRTMGDVCGELGRSEEALAYYQQALKCSREVKERPLEARSLLDVGIIHASMGHNKEALSALNEGLVIFRQLNDLTHQAHILSITADIYSQERRSAEALAAYTKGLRIYQHSPDWPLVCQAYFNIAGVYGRSGQRTKALAAYKEAYFTFCSKMDDRDSLFYPGTLQEVIKMYNYQGNSEAAITYGKLAVNAIQSIRIRNTQSQLSYLASYRSAYEDLFALLIKAKRLEEAEQVLRLLRQEDAFDFTARAPQLAKDLATLFQPFSFSTSERKYMPPDIASRARIGQSVLEGRRWQDALLEREKAGAGRSALLSTFNTKDAFTVILTTATTRRAFSYPIQKADFEALSRRLQGDLSNPRLDPRPDAQRMNQIVFCGGKLEEALQEDGITTALWFTSGSLRYIPISALYDGTQYLVQKERANIGVTLTSRRLFDDEKQGDTLAAGVSQSHRVEGQFKGDTPRTFPALSNVKKEVLSIVKDPLYGGTGPLPGKILLDGGFTAKSLERALNRESGISTVHIATHFFLNPKEEADSYLLMGDGKPLPISQWKQTLNLQRVNLLTLSACETGVGNPDATGGEVSSIGEVSQWLGARSVVVSLWSVNDSSTATLMSEFYAQWSAHPAQGKAQALRNAQRALLGTDATLPLTLASRGKPEPEDDDTSVPVFTAEPSHPYAHPYYWAPFNLIGNWK